MLKSIASRTLVLLLSSCYLSCTTFLRDTGGELLRSQAAYDVLHYDLDLEVFPESKQIAGTLLVRAAVTAPLRHLVLDLDPDLKVQRVTDPDGAELSGVVHEAGRLHIDLERSLAPGEQLEVTVEYGGQPREAPRPPWEGGFTWSRTAAGEHWIATSCQQEGADLWWPCKDHPSDKPDSFDLRVTVPRGLFCASNGRLISTEQRDERTETFHWAVSTPISNYSVALNIAPYVAVSEEYRCVTGEVLPVTFWALPESEQKARASLPEFLEHLRFMEEHFGPYPFRADKYGVVETPHLGMEHQTIIAYGNKFRAHKYKFDWLHHHELSHEWFANLVTAPDWNDFWIHEGFGSYTQKMYVEQKLGLDSYHQYLADVRGRILNRRPVAPRRSHSSGEMYFIDRTVADGQRQSDGDVYFKGEWILHTLRFLIGKQALFKSMRLLCYPDPALERTTDGSQCHFATTEDYRRIVEHESGLDLSWFFELYLRQPELPRLAQERSGETLQLRWVTPGDLPFPMPVEVKVGDRLRRVEMPNGRAQIELPHGAAYELDPSNWILRQGNRVLTK